MPGKGKERIDTAAILNNVDIVDVITPYLPLTRKGADYWACCPFHSESSPSFTVSQVKQFFHCFGCGAHGDAIGFLMQHQGLSFREACEAIGGESPVSPSFTPAQNLKPVKKLSNWTPLLPVPLDAPAPPKAHLKRGLPESVWCYRNAGGAVLGYVYRFRTSDGGKEVLPLTWCRNNETGELDWYFMAFPAPRPLYGLDKLAARPDATVLLVEGEKCADVGQAELSDLVVVSWPGGGKAVKKVDWLPLRGRKIVTWADCDSKHVPLIPVEREAGIDQKSKPLLPEEDQPGVKTMAQIAEILLANGCKLWNVTIPAPGEKPDGWDIADAVADGLSGEALADFIRGNILALAPAVEGGETVSTPPGAGAGDDFSDEDETDWRRKLLRKDGRLIDCRENVYLILKNHPAWNGVLWVDEFARKIVKRKPSPWDDHSIFKSGDPWGEDDDLRLGLWLAQQQRLLVRSAENLAMSIGWAARESSWHPVREYLDSLEWDGVSRSGDWLTDFLGVKKTEYSTLSGKLILIGMVARIYRPGCPMRSMPILEGRQFRGKSTALRILGGEWYGDSPLDLNNKDTYQLIQGRWLYEVAELDAFNRSESTRIKAFISSQEDRFRAPYDRAPREWPRQTVFFGTTNQDEHFKDSTGNTRYWPWRVEEVEPIDLDGLAKMRDQLFAEAVALFKCGERWHPTHEEQLRLFEPEQLDREIADPWESLIRKWLKTLTKDRVSLIDIIEGMKIDAAKIDSARQMSTRIGIAMKRLGWIKKRETSGDREYYYLRPAGWDRAREDEEGGDNEPF